MNLKKLLARLTCLVVMFAFLSGSTFAADWYVNSTNGNDVAFTGTADEPFRTIEKAISVAAADDIIHVAAGAYNEAAVDMDIDLTFTVEVFQNSQTAIIDNGIIIDADVTFTGSGNFETDALTLTSGTLSMASSNLTMVDGSAVTITAGDITATPTYEGEVSITYNVGANYTAGPEVPADFDGGDLTVNAAGFAVTINTAFAVNDIDVVAGTLTLGANASLDGDIDNDGTIDLGGFTLTYDPAAPTTVTDFGTIEDGTLIFTGDQNLTTTVAGIVLPDVVFDSNREATFTIGASMTVQDLTLNTAQADAILFAAGPFTLSVEGNFNRSNNTVGNFDATTNGGVLAFTGTNDASFDPGANLTLDDVIINKTDGDEVVTLDASVDVNGDFTITSGELELGNFNITMTGSGTTFDNGGSFYSTSGTGYLVFENTTNAGAEAVIASTGGPGSFGNILVNLPTADDVVSVDDDIEFSGTLFLNKGDFLVNATVMTFTDDVVDNPLIRINTLAANAVSFTNTGGTLTYSVDVSLYYEGPDNYTAGDEWDNNPTRLHNIDVRTTTGSLITGPAAASTASGRLYIAGDTEELVIGAGGLTLDGDGMGHVISGVADGDITVTGNASSITTPDTDSFAKTIDGALTINLGAVGETFTMSGINSVTGTITHSQGTSVVSIDDDETNDANLDGGITLTTGNLTFAMGPDGIIVEGAVALTAGTFTLGSDLEFDGVTTLSNAAVVLDGNTLQQDGLFTDNGTGSITGDGLFNVNYAGQAADADFTTNDLSVSNLSFTNAANVDIVGGSLTVTGTLTLDGTDVEIPTGENVTLTGDTFVFDAGTFTTAGTGVLVFNGGDMNADLSADFGAPSFTLNATTLTINDADDGGPYTFSVGTFTQTAGDVTLADDNNFQINDAFTRVAGTWTMGDGYFIVNDLGPHDIGEGFIVDNLDIAVATDFSDDAFTVNKNLRIANALDVQDDNNLTLADGVTVEITNNAANVQESDASDAIINALGDVNLVYSTAAAITTGFETGIASINNVTVETATAVTLADNMTVNGILTLDGTGANGTIDVDDNNLTMADGATLALMDQTGTAAIDISDPDGNFIPSGTLNLIYNHDAASLASTDVEWDDTYTIGTVEVNGNFDVLLHDDRAANGLLTISDAGDFDVNSNVLTLLGGVAFSDNGRIIGTGSAIFAGTDQTVTLTGGPWNVDGTLEVHIQVGDEDTVTVTGNNLNFDDNNDATADADLFLDNGMLNTSATANIILSQSEAGGFPTQGFDRETGNGIIIGNVQKRIRTDNSANASELIANQVVIFPVGDEAGNYRPAIFYFTDAVPTSFVLKVNHNSVDPGGDNGFPITSGDLTLTNYPDFFWYVQSSIPVNPSYQFDMELQAEGYTGYLEDDIENVRLIRRDSGSVNNQWRLQGSDLNYDNATLDVDWPTVKVIDATGGLTIQGSIFSYSQLNKDPEFAAALGDTTIAEGDTLSFTYVATDPDLGQTVTLSSVLLPEGATFNAETGAFSWIPGYTQAGTHTVTIRATDNNSNTDTTATITVENSPRAPMFDPATMPDDTVMNNATLTVDFNATDPDGDTLAYSLGSVTPALGSGGSASVDTLSGVLTFTPAFDDAGTTFAVTVWATDGVDSASSSVNIVVLQSAERGDADGDGNVSAFDASIILAAIVGNDSLSHADSVAADADLDGQVTAFDAYYILYYVANDNTWPSGLGKTSAVAGVAKFGLLGGDVENSVVKLPINLSNAGNVLSAYVEINVDEKYATYNGVSFNLPSGWITSSKYADGKLKIALVGMSELKDGDFAVVSLSLKDKEAKFSVDGAIALNNSSAIELGSTTVKQIPTQFDLSQNYPNPFNPTTKIKYSLAENTRVILTVYDMLGQKVASIVNEVQEAGYYTVEWRGTSDFGQKVASGVYIYRLEAGNFVRTMKMNLLK